jgi:predicted negative regulator of RcsB-dependent stress response
MLNCALDIWAVDSNAHGNEIARSTFLKGKVLKTLGKKDEALAAFKYACKERRRITKEDRTLESLKMEDFDRIVAFWSR